MTRRLTKTEKKLVDSLPLNGHVDISLLGGEKVRETLEKLEKAGYASPWHSPRTGGENRNLWTRGAAGLVRLGNRI